MLGRGPQSRIVFVIFLCQFIASLSALAMPPFFALILEKSFGHESGQGSNSAGFFASYAGLFYVIPTLFAAIANPVWGYLADRFGKKPLLLRAQIGLTLSFFIAGFARSPVFF